MWFDRLTNRLGVCGPLWPQLLVVQAQQDFTPTEALINACLLVRN
jgi:hypothetical protein